MSFTSHVTSKCLAMMEGEMKWPVSLLGLLFLTNLSSSWSRYLIIIIIICCGGGCHVMEKVWESHETLLSW